MAGGEDRAASPLPALHGGQALEPLVDNASAVLAGRISLEVSFDRVDERLHSGERRQLVPHGRRNVTCSLTNLAPQGLDSGEHRQDVLEVVTRFVVTSTSTAEGFELCGDEVHGRDREYVEPIGDAIRGGVRDGFGIPAVRRADGGVPGRDEVDTNVGKHEATEQSTSSVGRTSMPPSRG